MRRWSPSATITKWMASPSGVVVPHPRYLHRTALLRYGDDMPDRSGKRRPADLNRLAASIVEDATHEDKPAVVDDGKDPAAVSLGRRGGLKGGRARAEKLTAEQRSAIARKAARTRWRLGSKGV